MPSDVLITPASSKIDFTDGNNSTKRLNISGTAFNFNSNLNVLSSTSLSSAFKAEGVNGTLFEVIDDLSNSLMSVNTIGGLPVFEVFANNSIIGGQYGANDFVISGNKIGLGLSNPVNKLSVSGAVSIGASYNVAAPANGLIVQGNVGIGTVSPTNGTLQVYNASGNTLSLQKSGGFAALAMGSETTVYALIESINTGGIRFYTGNGTQAERWKITSAGVLESTGAQTIRTSIDSLTLATNAGNGHIILSPHGNGNVGIGTTSPAYKLDVNGVGRFIGNIALITDASSGDYSLIGHYYSGLIKAYSGYSGGLALYGGELGIQTRIQAGGQYVMSLLTNGNVGIGTTSPAAKLQINNASDSRLIVYETGTAPYTATLELSSQVLGTYGGTVQYTSNAETLTIENYGRTATNSVQGSILFKTKINNTTATNVAIINGFTGNVGIATLSPSEKLEVVGVIKGTSFSGAGTGLTGVASSLTAGTVTTNANLTGPITSVGNATTITNSAVTYAKIQNVNLNTVLGRITNTAGVVEELTGANIATIIGSNAVTNAVTAGTANALNTANSYEAVSLNLTGTLQFGGSINWNHGVTTELGRKTIGYNIWQGGKKLNADEDFNSGNNGITVYNNAGGTALTITRTSLATAPNSSGQVLRVSYNPGSNGTSPGFGGFFFGTLTSANKVFVTRFIANIPAGRSLTFHSNAYGTNANAYWLTNNVGTGKWEEYVFVVMCGNTGTFSSTNFFAISGGSDVAFTWDIASATVFDVTNKRDLVSSNFESYQSSNALTFNYLATNLNGNNPVPIYAFDVTSGAETRSIKAGLGYERHLTNGRGTLHIYNRSSDDAINITGLRSSAGDIKVSIDNAGNVGVGITIPSSKLHVYNSAGSSTIASNAIAVFEQNSNAGIQVCVPDSNEAGLFFSRSGAAYYSAITRSGTDLLLKNNSSTSITINSNGNVGVGITDPTAKLDVTGSNTNGYSLLLRSGDNYNGTDSVQIAFGFANQTNYRHSIRTRHNPLAPIGGVVGNNIDFYVWKRGTDAAADLGSQFVMTMQGDGNVGIGITSPSSLLNVSGTGTLGSVFQEKITNGTTTLALGTNATAAEVQSQGSVPLYLNYGGNNVCIVPVDSGSVGIGTTSPSARLDVRPTTAIAYQGTVPYQTTTAAILSPVMAAASVDTYTSILQLVSVRQALVAGRYAHGYLGFSTVDNSNISGILDAGRISIKNDDGVGLLSATSMGFWTNTGGSASNPATERVRIASDGNVGIGISSPNNKLDIRDGNLELSDTNFANIPEIRFTANSSGRYVFAGIKADEDGQFNGHLEFWTTPISANSTAANAAFAERMRITNAGNVGIGTSSPIGKLTVQGNIEVNYNSITADTFVRRTFLTPHATINRGANIAFGMVDGGGLVGMTVYNTAAAAGNFNSQFIAFNTHEGGVNEGERMRITQLGNVGIGTTSPLYKIDIAGSTGYDVTTDNATVLRVRSTTSRYPTFPGETTAIALTKTNEPYGWRLLSQYVADTYAGANFHIQNSINAAPAWESKLTILRDGNVGVGAITPNNKLAVLGSASIGSNYNVAAPTNGLIVEGNVAFGLTNPSSYASQLTIETTQSRAIMAFNTALADAGTLYGLGFGYAMSNYNSAYLSFYKVGNSSTSNRLSFSLWNQNDILNINGAGNVGIGITIPTAKLHVNSTTSGATLLRADGTNGTLFSVVDDLSDSLMSVNNSAGLPVLEVFADDRVVAGQYGANDFVLINNKLGLGTNSPAYKLDVRGSTVNARVGLMEFGAWPLDTTYIYLQNNSLSLIGANYGFLQGPTGETFVNAASGQTLHFRTGNTERWAITSGGILQSDGAQTIRTSTNALTLATNGGNGHIILSPNGTGNVGIGTTSPIAKLETYGGSMDPTLTPGDPSIFSVNSLGVQLAVGRMVTTPFSIWFQGKHATVGGGLTYPIVLNPLGGNVGIGTTSPTQKLDIVGSYGAADDNAGILKIRGPGAGPTQLNFGVSADGGYGWIQATDIAVDNDRNIILGPLGGNVGIGTISAATLLQIGTGTPTAATGGIQFGGDTGARIYRVGASTIQVSNNLTVGGTITGALTGNVTGNVSGATGSFSTSITANGIIINQERNTNARIYSAATGAMGLLGVNSDATFRWQIYGETGNYGFLESTWGNWDIKKAVNGELDLRVSSSLVRVLNAGNYQNYALPLAGGTLTGTLTATVIKGDAGANYPHSFTNTDAGNTHWINRGDRLLTSNGTGWQTDGRDPIMALVTSGNSNSLNIANSIGLTLHNESQTNNTFSPAITFSNRSNSGSYNTTYAAIIGRKTGQGIDSNWSAGELHFYTMPVGAYENDIPSLIINSAGNVGVGIIAPTSKLNVLSSTSLSSVFKAEGINGTLFEVTDDLSNSLMSVNTIGGLPVFEVFANNSIIAGQYGRNDFVISGNKIGIGTASPVYKLNVYDNSSGNIDEIFIGTIGNDQIAGGRTGGSFGISTKSTSNGNLILTASSAMYLRAGGNTRVFIKNDGNVGVGTETPANKLHVLTTGGAVNAPNVVAIFQANTATTTIAGGGTAIKFVGVSSGGNLQDYDQCMISSLGYADNNRHGIQFWIKPNGGLPLAVALTINSDSSVVANSSITAASFSGPLTGNVTGNVSGSSGSCTGNAATATKLFAAVNINGTSFDGSAAITTANWGTARTLTIGSTGKSVNGSGNVAWTLAEIGAVPSAGGTMAGTLTTYTPGVQTSLSGLSAYNAGVNVGEASIAAGVASFVPGFGQTTLITATGYRSHMILGSYRTAGANWNGGPFIAWGGNDAYPTEYWLFNQGGSITHSGGKTMAYTDGTNASGSWGISVTGTAANVTQTVAVANGGTGGTTQATGRSGLGATTVGANLFTLANPSAIRFIRINADNTVSTLNDADFRTAIGAGTGGGSGTVTTVSVVSANGFAGTVANATTTPAITLSTSITGVLKGNGTAISAATSGTDYLAPNTNITVNQLTATQAIIQKKVQPASNISGNVAVTIDVSSANVHVLTLDNGAVINSFSYTNRAADPAVNTILLVIKYLGTSASITWTNVIWANGNDPTLTKVNGYADVYALTSYKGTSGYWIGTVVAQNLLSTNL